MAGQSKSGTCFFLSDDESTTGVGVQYAKASGGSCNASVGAARRATRVGLDLVAARGTIADAASIVSSRRRVAPCDARRIASSVHVSPAPTLLRRDCCSSQWSPASTGS